MLRCWRHSGGRLDVGDLGRERVVEGRDSLGDEARHLDRAVLLEVRVIDRAGRTLREDARIDVQEHRLRGLRSDLVEVGTARGREVDEVDSLLDGELGHLRDVLGEAHVEQAGRRVERAARDGSDEDRGRAALAGALDVDAQVLLVVLRARVAVVDALGRVVVAELHEEVIPWADAAQHLVETPLGDEVLGGAPADGVVGEGDVVGEEPVDHLPPAGLRRVRGRVVGLHRRVARDVGGRDGTCHPSGKPGDRDGVERGGSACDLEREPTVHERDREGHLQVRARSLGVGEHLGDALGRDRRRRGGLLVAGDQLDRVVPGAELDLEGRAVGGDEVLAKRIPGVAVDIGGGIRGGLREAVAPLRVEGGGARDGQGALGEVTGAEVERHDVTLRERCRRHIGGGVDRGGRARPCRVACGDAVRPLLGGVGIRIGVSRSREGREIGECARALGAALDEVVRGVGRGGPGELDTGARDPRHGETLDCARDRETGDLSAAHRLARSRGAAVRARADDAVGVRHADLHRAVREGRARDTLADRGEGAGLVAGDDRALDVVRGCAVGGRPGEVDPVVGDAVHREPGGGRRHDRRDDETVDEGAQARAGEADRQLPVGDDGAEGRGGAGAARGGLPRLRGAFEGHGRVGSGCCRQRVADRHGDVVLAVGEVDVEAPVVPATKSSASGSAGVRLPAR